MAKSTPAPKPVVVERMDKRKLASRMVDVAGMTQQQADEAIQGFTIAVGTWLEAMARGIPRGTRAEVTLEGMGKLAVTYEKKRKSTNRWRLRNKIPDPPALMVVTFEPTKSTASIIAKENATIRKEHKPIHLAAYALAKADYLAHHIRYSYPPRQLPNDTPVVPAAPAPDPHHASSPKD